MRANSEVSIASLPSAEFTSSPGTPDRLSPPCDVKLLDSCDSFPEWKVTRTTPISRVRDLQTKNDLE